MSLPTLKEQVRAHISKAKTKDAIDQVAQWAHENNQEQLKSDIALLKGEWTELNRQKNLGMLSYSDMGIQMNTLHNKILGLLNSVEENTTDVSTPPPNTGAAFRKTIDIPVGFTGEISQTITAAGGKILSNIGRAEEAKPKIYFSYAWGDAEEIGDSREKIVGELFETLKTEGYHVVRDKEDLEYKDLISEFMREIGRGSFIVIAISDKYLKSQNCMFELYEIYRNSKLEKAAFIEKIYPIRVESIRLSDPSVMDIYFEHWEKLEKEWTDFIEKRGTRISPAQQERFKRIKTIASELGEFLELLSDINMKSRAELSQNNFEEIKQAIKSRVKK